jgi:hypothetical protein
MPWLTAIAPPIARGLATAGRTAVGAVHAAPGTVAALFRGGATPSIGSATQGLSAADLAALAKAGADVVGPGTAPSPAEATLLAGTLPGNLSTAVSLLAALHAAGVPASAFDGLDTLGLEALAGDGLAAGVLDDEFANEADPSLQSQLSLAQLFGLPDDADQSSSATASPFPALLDLLARLRLRPTRRRVEPASDRPV